MGIQFISADQIISCTNSLAEASGETNTNVGAVTQRMVEELQERRRNGDYLWSSDTSKDGCLKDSLFHLTSFLLHSYHNPENLQRLIARELTLVSRRIHPYGDGCASLETRGTFVRKVFDYAETRSKLNILGPAMERVASESQNIKLLRLY